MKIPQYITAYRAVAVGITLLIMVLLLVGDLVGPFAKLLKGV